jgi:hypothetical protein
VPHLIAPTIKKLGQISQLEDNGRPPAPTVSYRYGFPMSGH